MKTVDQQKDEDRLRRYIEREVLSSTMNDTKWRELQEVMLSFPDRSPSYRLKCLRSPEPKADSWDCDWHYHMPQPFLCIEWIEIDPVMTIYRGHLVPPIVIDRTEAVTAALKQIGIPFTFHESFIRIVAHTLRAEQIGPANSRALRDDADLKR